MLAEISGFFSFTILINCPEAYLSLLTFLLVYQLILAAFVIVARQFCLRRICSFPANLLFPLDPAVTLLIKVNTSCLVCIWKSKDSEWETNGRCCNRWCLRAASSPPLPEVKGEVFSWRRTNSTVPPPSPAPVAWLGTQLHKAAEVETEHCLCKAADGGIT